MLKQALPQRRPRGLRHHSAAVRSRQCDQLIHGHARWDCDHLAQQRSKVCVRVFVCVEVNPCPGPRWPGLGPLCSLEETEEQRENGRRRDEDGMSCSGKWVRMGALGGRGEATAKARLVTVVAVANTGSKTKVGNA
eukprot:366474-Chlamydomonas_euryale.AAC.38